MQALGVALQPRLLGLVALPLRRAPIMTFTIAASLALHSRTSCCQTTLVVLYRALASRAALTSASARCDASAMSELARPRARARACRRAPNFGAPAHLEFLSSVS